MNELRTEAKKRTDKVTAFYICGIVFLFTGIILIALSTQIASASFWLLLPIPALLMVQTILYFSVFGLPWRHSSSDDWEKEEIEKEMIRLYLSKKEEFTEELKLDDLKELEAEAMDKLEQHATNGGYL